MKQVEGIPIPAIKEFFEMGEHGREVGIREMKALSPEERRELGQLAAEFLEYEWVKSEKV